MFDIGCWGPGTGNGFFGKLFVWGGWPVYGGILKEPASGCGCNELLGNVLKTGPEEGTGGP